MDINDYDYVEPKGVEGKIILTCFPGRIGEKKLFNKQLFLEELENFHQINCSSIVSLVEDIEFQNMYDKKLFVHEIYDKNLNWFHLPIVDLKAPDYKFVDKWQTTKSLLKNELIYGKNIVIHCMGGKGRSGTIAAILLIEFGDVNTEVTNIVRKKRNGAIETKEQEDFILSYRTHN
jgi:protein-tyrosine phosphatase|tara:strand:- start:720 stop:1247 length:528 start_codon:yes stop_codon:yes gene_type:complete